MSFAPQGKGHMESKKDLHGYHNTYEIPFSCTAQTKQF